MFLRCTKWPRTEACYQGQFWAGLAKTRVFPSKTQKPTWVFGFLQGKTRVFGFFPWVFGFFPWVFGFFLWCLFFFFSFFFLPDYMNSKWQLFDSISNKCLYVIQLTLENIMFKFSKSWNVEKLAKLNALYNSRFKHSDTCNMECQFHE